MRRISTMCRGRKTDAKDGAWIAQLLECGLLHGSFVPPREIREVRDLTRYRKTLVQQRSEEVLRLRAFCNAPASSYRLSLATGCRDGRYWMQVPYHDLRPDFYIRRNQEAIQRRCVRQLHQLGFQVELTPRKQAA